MNSSLTVNIFYMGVMLHVKKLFLMRHGKQRRCFFIKTRIKHNCAQIIVIHWHFCFLSKSFIKLEQKVHIYNNYLKCISI